MLHVLVGASCNNNCLFCMEADREGRSAHIATQSRDDVLAMIRAYPADDEVLFTSGEPTLNPHLVEYVAAAREKGFKIIGLISNGRRLAYRDYVHSLVAAGLNRATVSIHGHEAPLHDSLTRAPGSFSQTRAGLLNLVDARRRAPLAIHTSTVITKRNLPFVAPIHRMLWTIGVDSIVYNIMMAKGRGARHLDALMPRYPDVLSAFASLCTSLDELQLRKTRVVDVPPCISSQLPAPVRGSLEDFDQYELVGSTGLRELAVPSPACDNSRAPRLAPVPDALQRRLDAVRFDKDGRIQPVGGLWPRMRHVIDRLLRHPPQPPAPSSSKRSDRIEAFGHGRDTSAPEEAVIAKLQSEISEVDLEAQNRYYATSRAFKDRFLRAKGPPCDACTANTRCPGVWEPYVARFGWDDIRPLSSPAPSILPGAPKSLEPRD